MTDNNANNNHNNKNNNNNDNNNVTSNENNPQNINHSNKNNNTHKKINSSKLQIPNGQHKEKTSAEANANTNTVKTKKKHRDKSDLGDNFIAPDGGWGWLVAIAGGVGILVSLAPAQQFGIIFRERITSLDITNSELTTIINMQVAISAFTGLLNGPMFRRFTYRQVALLGSFLTFLGIFLAVFADSFIFFLCCYSLLYGFGRGIFASASSLAVNTFFKLKRRTATAYQFGIAGLGPIFLPYLATFLLQFLGVQGTVLIFSGISLHSLACSLIYQPVRWHVKKPSGDAEALQDAAYNLSHDEHESDHITEPETPILPIAKDGWFGSRQSLTTSVHRNRLGTWEKEMEGSLQIVELKHLNSRDNTHHRPRQWSLSHSFKEEQSDANFDKHDMQHSLELPQKSAVELHELPHEERKKLPFYKKVVIFFDLYLLRDVTYVNLAIGLTLINFVEINFAVLMPFILSDFGFANNQIAMAMSILGVSDLVIRFLIPVLTAKINSSNKVFFVFGIIGMCVGRAVLSVTRDFYMMLAVFVWMGLNKAFRTVFWSIIIPGYVPLKNLPAATGLQLLMSGIFSMTFGPLIGIIRDNTNYAFTLNFLNSICILALFMWIMEALWRKHQRKSTTKPVSGDSNWSCFL